ncbi:MAG: hypothetical protein ACLQVW_30880 [Limisphaerales bacterium]
MIQTTALRAAKSEYSFRAIIAGQALNEAFRSPWPLSRERDAAARDACASASSAMRTYVQQALVVGQVVIEQFSASIFQGSGKAFSWKAANRPKIARVLASIRRQMPQAEPTAIARWMRAAPMIVCHLLEIENPGNCRLPTALTLAGKTVPISSLLDESFKADSSEEALFRDRFSDFLHNPELCGVAEEAISDGNTAPLCIKLAQRHASTRRAMPAPCR